MTLRLRLSMLAVVLVAAGLLAAGIATRYELRGFLIDRVDSQLTIGREPGLALLRARRHRRRCAGAGAERLATWQLHGRGRLKRLGAGISLLRRRWRARESEARGDPGAAGDVHPGRLPRVRDTRPGQGRLGRPRPARDRDAASRRQLDAQPAGHAGAAGRPDRAGGGGSDRVLAGTPRAAAAGADRGHGRGDRRRRPHTARARGGARHRGR